MPVTLFTGFLVDYITFVNIQVDTAIIILFVHFVLCGLALLFVYAYDAGKITEKLRYLRLFLPLLIQFNFGGMLSNAFIFYWFSGSLTISWPYIVLFVLLMVGNDALREHYARPTVQLSVYFFATFTILSVSLPFVFHSINPSWFVLSGVLALVLMFGFFRLLAVIAVRQRINWKNVFISVGVIFFTTNFFYFANLIPPVPLAVREEGVYHNVARLDGRYLLIGEQENFWERLVPGRTIHIIDGQPIYIFSAIFAPRDLNTTIVHEWRYYDETREVWIIKDRLSFNLTGGRQEGFRGYTLKTTVVPGKWKVFIKTERGQTLGRVRFDVVRPTGEEELVEVVR